MATTGLQRVNASYPLGGKLQIKLAPVLRDPVRERRQYTVASAVLSFCHICRIFNEWAMLGSNQRPLPCEGSALPLS